MLPTMILPSKLFNQFWIKRSNCKIEPNGHSNNLINNKICYHCLPWFFSKFSIICLNYTFYYDFKSSLDFSLLFLLSKVPVSLLQVIWYKKLPYKLIQFPMTGEWTMAYELLPMFSVKHFKIIVLINTLKRCTNLLARKLYNNCRKCQSVNWQQTKLKNATYSVVLLNA